MRAAFEIRQSASRPYDERRPVVARNVVVVGHRAKRHWFGWPILAAFLRPTRGEAIGHTTEVVAVIQVFRIGLSGSLHAAILGLELHGLRGGD